MVLQQFLSAVEQVLTSLSVAEQAGVNLTCPSEMAEKY
jgi:hypothetical protein